MLRFLTAGESHGPAMTVILEGIPSGLPLTAEMIDLDLRARQQGAGRSARQKIECDCVEFLGGVRNGHTIGAPIAMRILNKAHGDMGPITTPRPGHADLAGGLKHDLHDMRNICERASARETVARVAAGSVARQFLRRLGTAVQSHVVGIGAVTVPKAAIAYHETWFATVAESPVRCGDPVKGAAMVEAIQTAQKSKESLGGTFEIVVTGVPPGLGNYMQWDLRLDGLLAQAIMSIPGIKGVEIGMGFDVAHHAGSAVHDPVHWDSQHGMQRCSNHAGGLEGGMTNGEPLVVRAAMKPLSTLMDPLPSVDVVSKVPTPAHIERADVCAVPAAGRIGEAMAALTLARVALEKFGGDALHDVESTWKNYGDRLKAY
jgi:chorismate synthase